MQFFYIREMQMNLHGYENTNKIIRNLIYQNEEFKQDKFIKSLFSSNIYMDPLKM